MNPASEVIARLKGKTLGTAESITGGGIGAALTAVSGASEVYKGGIISYTDAVKASLLHVPREMLRSLGAVSGQVAEAMAVGALHTLDADIAVSVTGLAGPGGDDYGNPVGRVYIGYADCEHVLHREYSFSGDRESVRQQTIEAALKLILEQNP